MKWLHPLLLFATLLPSITMARPPRTFESVASTYCEVETDCPAFLFCYPTTNATFLPPPDVPNAIGMCGCYKFYGHSGPLCEDQSAALFPIIFAGVMFLYSFVTLLYNILTMVQLHSVGALPLQNGPALVLTYNCLSEFFVMCMLFAYIYTLSGYDKDYTMNDNYKPWFFGLKAVFRLASCYEIPHLWMKVIINAPIQGMTHAKKAINKVRFKKFKILSRSNTVVNSTLVMVCLALKLNTVIAAYFVFVSGCVTLMYRVQSRKLASTLAPGCLNKSAVVADSKTNERNLQAAMDMLTLSGKVGYTINIGYVVMLVAYAISVKRPSTGITPVLCITSLFFAATTITQHQLWYIRRGNRNKLSKKGYMKKTANMIQSTETSLSDSSIEENGEEEV